MIRYSPLYLDAIKEAGRRAGRFLNPGFAEWLHGLPVGWTAASPLAGWHLNGPDAPLTAISMP
jgi:hypothetical protein